MKICAAIGGVASLGSRLRALELGRNGSSHVANFGDPKKISIEQRFQTEDIATNAEEEGLEFVRTWNIIAISTISLVPFGLSLVFAAVWIAVSVQKHGVNPQVATQTAFTVASYVGTAGKFRCDLCDEWKLKGLGDRRASDSSLCIFR